MRVPNPSSSVLPCYSARVRLADAGHSLRHRRARLPLAKGTIQLYTIAWRRRILRTTRGYMVRLPPFPAGPAPYEHTFSLDGLPTIEGKPTDYAFFRPPASQSDTSVANGRSERLSFHSPPRTASRSQASSAFSARSHGRARLTQSPTMVTPSTRSISRIFRIRQCGSDTGYRICHLFHSFGRKVR